MNYTKRSDIYALGKTLEEVFTGVEVPSEVSKMIEHMIEPDPVKREDNMPSCLDTLNNAIEQLEQPRLRNGQMM